MFRKRYLTIHETRDANARTMSILCLVSLLRGHCHLVTLTYSVVKFIVNVKLVENRANSTVGKVIVVNVMIQISKPGMPLAIASKT